MKLIFKNFAAALVACVAMLSVSSVFALTKQGFETKEECISAAQKGGVEEYVPLITRPTPGTGWVEKTAGQVSLHGLGICAKGYTVFSRDKYVFFHPSFKLVEKGEEIRMKKCFNEIDSWASVPPAPQPAIAQAVAVAAAPAPAAAPPVPAAPEVCISCMLVEHNRIGKESCDKLEGVFTQATSLKPEGAYRCDYPRGYGQFTPNTGSHTAPVHTVTNQAPRLVDNRQAYTVAVPQGPALVIQQAPAPVQVQTQCNNNCSYRPVARVVNSVPGAYCGIHTTDGRKFKLVRNDGRAAGALMLVDISAGVDGRAMAIPQYNVDQQGWDCNKAQTAVETQHWAGVTNFFALPNACQVASRVNGRMQ